MRQESYTSIEDFVFDPTFRDWLLDNNSSYKNYWESWMAENPDKVPLLNYAKAIVFALTIKHKKIPEQDTEYEVKGIMKKISSANVISTVLEKEARTARRGNRIYTILALAASLFGMSVLILLYFNTRSPRRSDPSNFETLTQKTSPGFIEHRNTTDSTLAISLADGTAVQLRPNSKIGFIKNSFNAKREVHLSGEAVFSVAKNHPAAFVVFTEKLVAKVLGTTFILRAYEHAAQVSLQVNSGKVSVYKKENFAPKSDDANYSHGLIVLPNQRAIYDAGSNSLRKGIVAAPVALTTVGDDFVFHSRPANEAFKTLEKVYGIPIIYDETVMNSCLISTSITEAGFYKRLQAICKATNASYESIDGGIYVSSKGCK